MRNIDEINILHLCSVMVAAQANLEWHSEHKNSFQKVILLAVHLSRFPIFGIRAILRFMNKPHALSSPDLILSNGKFLTCDPLMPIAAEVEVRDGKILRVRNRIAEAQKSEDVPPKILDLKGKVVVPGFVDPHLHFFSLAESFVTLNLEPRNNISSIAHIKERIHERSQNAKPGEWIRGRGYNEFYLEERRHPNRWDLDDVAPSHPVKIAHRTGHAHVLNSLGLERVGISICTSDPSGGIIDRDINTGEPTGLLYEMGRFLSERISPLTVEEFEPGARRASQELLSQGITSMQDASTLNDFSRWESFRVLKKRGLISPDLCMMLGIESFNTLDVQDFRANFDSVRIQGIKIILDETTGRLYPSPSELNDSVLRVHQAGFQVAIHAVEEGAIKSACDAIENALRKYPRLDHRHRIEHCSVCPPALAGRLSSLGIRIVTQPSFVYYNGDRYLEMVPANQLSHLYPIGTFLQTGIKVAAGSDAPIAPLNPMIGIYSSISRKCKSGKVINVKEGISPLEALKMHTSHAAEVLFEEDRKGSITPGKLADMVVLSGDPTNLPVEQIKEIRVDMTIIRGDIVWTRDVIIQ